MFLLSFSPFYIYLSSYTYEQRHQSLLAVLFIKTLPEKSYLLFAELEKVWQHSTVYQGQLSSAPTVDPADFFLFWTRPGSSGLPGDPFWILEAMR